MPPFESTETTSATRIIRKYPNRRLYDVDLSRYITYNHLHTLMRNGVTFEVIQAKTRVNITHAVMLDVLVWVEKMRRVQHLPPLVSQEEITAFVRAGRDLFGQ